MIFILIPQLFLPGQLVHFSFHTLSFSSWGCFSVFSFTYSIQGPVIPAMVVSIWTCLPHLWLYPGENPKQGKSRSPKWKKCLCSLVIDSKKWWIFRTVEMQLMTCCWLILKFWNLPSLIYIYTHREMQIYKHLRIIKGLPLKKHKLEQCACAQMSAIHPLLKHPIFSYIHKNEICQEILLVIKKHLFDMPRIGCFNWILTIGCRKNHQMSKVVFGNYFQKLFSAFREQNNFLNENNFSVFRITISCWK